MNSTDVQRWTDEGIRGMRMSLYIAALNRLHVTLHDIQLPAFLVRKHGDHA